MYKISKIVVNLSSLFLYRWQHVWLIKPHRVHTSVSYICTTFDVPLSDLLFFFFAGDTIYPNRLLKATLFPHYCSISRLRFILKLQSKASDIKESSLPTQQLSYHRSLKCAKCIYSKAAIASYF